ncbi:MAG: flagellin lysine-N-methylase [Ruminococcus sp.]|nr:flagellin lysine-N-methylase [Ruminococcus sp.]
MNNKIKVQYIRQPQYYKDFQCTGDKCPVNCCYGWNIGWSKEEYEKLTNAQMPDSLRKIIEQSFILACDTIKDTFDYQIKFSEKGKCPLLTENGLCSIQKELGADYLSCTCRTYPRKNYLSGDAVIRTCECSCNCVIKIICSDENSMELENITKNQINKNTKFSLSENWEEQDYFNHPALKYDRELFEFFYAILSDRSRSIETSIVLAAVAARKVDEFVKKGSADRIPEIIKALRPRLDDPAQTEKLENAKPNISLKANIAAALLKIIKGSDIYQYVFENGVPSEEKFNEGTAKWNEVYRDRPFVMRNIALNLFISQRMPFRDKTLTLFENFCYLAAEMSVIKFLAAAVFAHFDKANEEMFEVAVSHIDRSFTHNELNVKKVIDVLRAAGIGSPAYLMGILK